MNAPNARASGPSRIALLAPMRMELQPFTRPLGLAPGEGASEGFLFGSSRHVDVVATMTGIGMHAAARQASRMLDANTPEHLIVVGIAGGIGESVAVGDLVVPETVLNLETGETYRPTPLGSARPRGTLASADGVLESPADAERVRQRGVIAVDMETAAVAAICEERGCPWSVFRAVSDRADDGTTDAAVLELAGSDGNASLASVVRFVLRRPHRIPQLVRLGMGASKAARTAATATLDALGSL